MNDSIDWLAIARLETGVDYHALSQMLDDQNIAHRINRSVMAGHLILEIAQTYQRPQALSVLHQYMAESAAANPANLVSVNSEKVFQAFPVVITCVIFSILGALLVHFKFEWVHWFTYLDYQIVGEKIFFVAAEHSFQKGQYWRLLTPAFLHFGLFHVVFNSLWLWELGRRIEKLAGSLHLLIIVITTAIISNIAQYQMEGPSLFGGMSGVVYALLGYIWIRRRISPHPLLAIAPGLLVLMIGWLVLCMTGLVDLMISGKVANAAHVGGLLSGMVLGFWSGKRSSRQVVSG